MDKINVFLENLSLPFLEDLKVDYHPDKFGGQLTIRAPNAKMPELNENSTIEDKINYFLYSETNPSRLLLTAVSAHFGRSFREY